jgi:hypothetical protein
LLLSNRTKDWRFQTRTQRQDGILSGGFGLSGAIRGRESADQDDYLSLKNKTVVEYALRSAVRPIGVATYSIVPQLPDAYRDELPSPEAIAERLRLWDNKLNNT